MTAQLSAQSFVRLLKAPTDPPDTEGPSKIHIACTAWDDTTLHIPNKHELIAEFILTRFLKDKSKFNDNPTVDARYWCLLRKVLDASVGVNARGPKIWLGSLLNRVPLAPIIITMLTLLRNLSDTISKDLLLLVRPCFSVLWPLSVHKIGVDTLLECFGTVLDVFGWLGSDEALEDMCEAIVSSYGEALGNAGNKKKLHSTFLQIHFSSWIRAVSPSHLPTQLNEAVYAAGTETLFSLDALRISPSSEALFAALSSFAISPSSTNTVISLIPILFDTHMHFLRRYRTALFPAFQNKSQSREDEIRITSMTFFNSCLELLTNDAQSWNARLGLVSTIATERIYASEAGGRIVDRLREDAVRVLETEAEQEAKPLALDVLAVLARLDYDVIEPVVERILPRLILTHHAPSTHKSASIFLDVLLDFYTKTRKLYTYTNALIGACTSLPSTTSLVSPQELYANANTSAILVHTHLSSLAQAFRTFLTPTQAKEAVQIITTLKETFYIYQKLTSPIVASEMEAEDRPRKKRRKSEPPATLTTSNDTRQLDFHALSLSFTFKLAALLLSNLPSSFVTAEVRDAVHETGVWAIGACALLLGKRSSKISWADQVTGVALLRSAYHLSAWKYAGEPGDMQALLDVVKIGEVEGELAIEILRFLFAWASRSETDMDMETIFNFALFYIEARKPNSQSGLMVLYLIVERWLDHVDARASRSSIDRLVKLIFSIHPYSPRQVDVQGLRLRDVLWGVFHNAQFWEMGNIRVSFLAHLNSSSSLNSHAFEQLGRNYYFLLYVPPEYLTRQARVELVRQAVEGDIAVSSAFHTNNEETAKRRRHESNDQEEAWKTLLYIRVFLLRMGQLGYWYLNTPDHESARDYVKHLVHTEIPCDAVLNNATIDLVELYITTLLRVSNKDPSASTACASILCSIAHSISQKEGNISKLCMLQIVKRLTKNFSISSISDSTVASMKTLYTALTPAVHSDMSDIPSSGAIKTWAHHLSFGHWLGIPAIPAASAWGRQTAVALLRKEGKCTSSAETLGLLFEELHCLPNVNRGMHLDLAMGVYICSAGVEDQVTMDEVVSNGCKNLPIDDFSHLLDTVYEALTSAQFPPAQYVRLVHVATVLLHESPQGTLKVIQAFFSRCLGLFVGHTEFLASPTDLKVACLEFVVQQCSDRPAALCAIDSGPIHVILSKVLCGSSTHDSMTTSSIFHSVTTILNALIRLRRDLIVHVLPQLGLVLRQLVSCIRNLRPQLAAKQSRIVTDTLPSWIAPSDPLGAPEARALARLFTSLAAKTVPRTHMQPGMEQKAESLSKPFAKHAAYVVTAYIDAVNDPLCVMRVDVRRELEPGLFSLCEMMGTHSRDAVMVSVLDTGGKSVMKALWKEYEKQRYVGKG